MPATGFGCCPDEMVMTMDNCCCAGCGIELMEGQNVYGLTRGSINSELYGFRIDDNSEWEYFCSDCMNKIDQFLADCRKSLLS
jgi:hypothetical protein